MQTCLSNSSFTGDIESLKKSVSEGKKQLATTLTSLGVPTASDASFEEIVANITILQTNSWNNGYNNGYAAGASSVPVDSYRFVAAFRTGGINRNCQVPPFAYNGNLVSYSDGFFSVLVSGNYTFWGRNYSSYINGKTTRGEFNISSVTTKYLYAGDYFCFNITIKRTNGSVSVSSPGVTSYTFSSDWGYTVLKATTVVNRVSLSSFTWND